MKIILGYLTNTRITYPHQFISLQLDACCYHNHDYLTKFIKLSRSVHKIAVWKGRNSIVVVVVNSSSVLVLEQNVQYLCLTLLTLRSKIEFSSFVVPIHFLQNQRREDDNEISSKFISCDHVPFLTTTLFYKAFLLQGEICC